MTRKNEIPIAEMQQLLHFYIISDCCAQCGNEGWQREHYFLNTSTETKSQNHPMVPKQSNTQISKKTITSIIKIQNLSKTKLQ